MPKSKPDRRHLSDPETPIKKSKIVVTKDGPYLVSGGLPLGKEIAEVGEEGDPERWVRGAQYPARDSYSLCRCGKSRKQPFCDGTHSQAGFDGTEKASRKSYDELAQTIHGPELDLKDAEPLCSSARFCLPDGGTWELTLKSDDPRKRKLAIKQAGKCPSGRLVMYDSATGIPIEPNYAPSLSLLEDPQAESSGPIWVKGRVVVESEDGEVYETRNRVTLCRCGRSKNKPFCDGTHVEVRFNDGDDSLRVNRARAGRSNV